MPPEMSLPINSARRIVYLRLLSFPLSSLFRARNRERDN
jgi:hypothetical protein